MVKLLLDFMQAGGDHGLANTSPPNARTRVAVGTWVAQPELDGSIRMRRIDNPICPLPLP
ncbi:MULTISPECIES: hypothetical protein [Xanthomonas]|uniref:hypothetical protein n=1 Tax=Xanthomonas oryzae TaxID=347 RepID=UPI000949F21A